MSDAREQYALSAFDDMLADPLRTPAYLAAIAAIVKPGDVVVEIGAGTGYFSVAAARAGARTVYAIERSAVAAVAREIVAENGVADRVTVISADAATADLPERGDVLLFDLAGWLPYHADAIPTIIAARERLVHSGARLISAHDRVFAAPCTAPAGWAEVELALGESPFGISRKAASRLAHSAPHRERVGIEALRGDPLLVGELDYRTVVSPDVDATLEWTMRGDDTLHGLICWFETSLAPGIGFSTGPGAPSNVYGQPFFPFQEPIVVRAGDRLCSHLRLKLYGAEYLYAWDTTLIPSNGRDRRIDFSQSTLAASLVASGGAPRGRLL